MDIKGFEHRPCHMIQICIACITTKPTRSATAGTVPDLNSPLLSRYHDIPHNNHLMGHNNNCNDNNATTKAATTWPWWPPHCMTWRDIAINFVTTIVILLSPFRVTGLEGPIRYLLIYLNSAHSIWWATQASHPIDDLTSTLDYKTSCKGRPPPLPKMDLLGLRSAEEVVMNILYSTPPPSL